MAGEFNTRSLPSLPDGPSPHVYMLTPSDTALTKPIRMFRAAVAGDVKVTCLNGADEVITVIAGEPIPGAFTKVWLTGTTATTFLAYE